MEGHRHKLIASLAAITALIIPGAVKCTGYKGTGAESFKVRLCDRTDIIFSNSCRFDESRK